MTTEATTDLIQFRRQLHQYPELGYNEFNTARSIRQKLDIRKIPYQSGIAKTGIVAELSKGNGKCIALRADMDALPIQEETNLEFASKNKGIMHACGHDVHTTMLLGAAMKLKDSDFSGRIKFIFQPSEEGVNGDSEKKSGGQRIVESGILKDVDYALGLHVNPLLEVGALSFAPGNAFAYTSNIAITILGKAGHAGAAPHLSVDAILIAGTLIQNLNTIVSRNISPTKSGVVSITMIKGGIASNIIADSVKMRGTIRSFSTLPFIIIFSTPFFFNILSCKSGSNRHIRFSPLALIHIFPFTIKARPPNIFFSSTFNSGKPDKYFLILSASLMSKAIHFVT